jgi:hypothetical protein
MDGYPECGAHCGRQLPRGWTNGLVWFEATDSVLWRLGWMWVPDWKGGGAWVCEPCLDRFWLRLVEISRNIRNEELALVTRLIALLPGP